MTYSYEAIRRVTKSYRPGCLDARVEDPNSPHYGKTMVEVYVDRASGKSEVEYDHPLLSEVLADTYGVIVFQEQVMRTSVVLSGFTKAESDSLRKVVGKKIMEEMPVQKAKFISGCKNNKSFVELTRADVDAIIEKIWSQIETFGRLNNKLQPIY